MRPYKGIDVLLEAWRGIEGAELWIAGMPRMDIAPLRARGAAERALRPALHRRRRAARPTSAAPTSSCCPTARSTSRACCSPRSRSASRCCSATSAASPRSPRPARRGIVPAGDAAALHGALRGAARRPRGAASAGRAGRRAAARRVLLGERSPQRTLALYALAAWRGPSPSRSRAAARRRPRGARRRRAAVRPSGPGLAGARHLGRDADRVERGDLDDLVVEPDAPAARDHDVDLLGLVVAVAERGCACRA